MLELTDRDLIFSTEDSAIKVIASSNVGKAVSGSELEVREGGGDGLVSAGSLVGMMMASEVGGGGISEGYGVVCSGCGFG